MGVFAPLPDYVDFLLSTISGKLLIETCLHCYFFLIYCYYILQALFEFLSNHKSKSSTIHSKEIFGKHNELQSEQLRQTLQVFNATLVPSKKQKPTELQLVGDYLISFNLKSLMLILVNCDTNQLIACLPIELLKLSRTDEGSFQITLTNISAQFRDGLITWGSVPLEYIQKMNFTSKQVSSIEKLFGTLFSICGESDISARYTIGIRTPESANELSRRMSHYYDEVISTSSEQEVQNSSKTLSEKELGVQAAEYGKSIAEYVKRLPSSKLERIQTGTHHFILLYFL